MLNFDQKTSELYVSCNPEIDLFCNGKLTLLTILNRIVFSLAIWSPT